MRNTPSYHKRVMKSRHKFQVVRTCRRTGKTTLACQWALDGLERRVLFITPNDIQAQAAQEIVAYHAGLSVVVNQRGKIVTSTGKEIWFMGASALERRTTGLSVDKIIVDEFGYIDASTMDTIGYLKAVSDASVLMLTSSTRLDSIACWLEKYQPVVEYHTYDMYDAIKEGLYDRKGLSDMIESFADNIFIDEFGPWKGFWGEANNQRYSYLLKK